MTKIEGWTAPGFEGVSEVFQGNFDKESEDGAGFAAYHRGQKVVDLWGGVADTTTGRMWDENTMVLTYSTTKPQSTETVLRSGDVVILGWRLAPSESFHDDSGKQGVRDQVVECGSRSGGSWTVVGHPEDCGQV
jgi:hypothetical protein